MPKRARSASGIAAPASPPTPTTPSPTKPAKKARRDASNAFNSPSTHFGDVPVADAIAHITSRDERLSAVVAEAGILPRIAECQAARAAARESHRAFRSLARAIVFQQLNGAAAATIFARVVAVAAPDADPARLSPAGILSADEAAMRACGLSQRKLEYLRGLALAFTPANQVEGGGGLDDETLECASAEDVTRSLVALRGLGPWTVHMFRMFYLNHADVLPVGDFGVRRGMMLLYGLSSMPGPEKMQAIAEPWAPYRTIGAMYMWRVADDAKENPKVAKGNGKGKGNGEGKRETPR